MGELGKGWRRKGEGIGMAPDGTSAAETATEGRPEENGPRPCGGSTLGDGDESGYSLPAQFRHVAQLAAGGPVEALGYSVTLR